MNEPLATSGQSSVEHSRTDYLPSWRRRLAFGLLLTIGIGAGWWWNATRLNATERQLVGVWAFPAYSNGTPRQALMLLPDRRRFAFEYAGILRGHREDHWVAVNDYDGWRATPSSFHQRHPPHRPWTGSLRDWWEYLKAIARGGNKEQWSIIRRSESELTLSGEQGIVEGVLWAWESYPRFEASDQFSETTLKRSEDPELLRFFDRLKAGETPEQLQAEGKLHSD